MYIYTFVLRVTDTMISQNIDLSSWDTLYRTLQKFSVNVMFTEGPESDKHVINVMHLLMAVYKPKCNFHKMADAYITLSPGKAPWYQLESPAKGSPVAFANDLCSTELVTSMIEIPRLSDR
jgi:hypothetical protein